MLNSLGNMAEYLLLDLNLVFRTHTFCSDMVMSVCPNNQQFFFLILKIPPPPPSRDQPPYHTKWCPQTSQPPLEQSKR